MPKRKIRLTHSKHRSILTDMLPFEVPPTFSNRGFYSFLKKYQVELVDGRVQWTADGDEIDLVLLLIFGLKLSTIPASKSITEWGKTKSRRIIELSKAKMGTRDVLDTVPFNFRVAHKLDGRTLSVVHPKNQIEVAAFYSQFSSTISYYASLSEFSIRRPVAVSRYSYFKDSIHEQALNRISKGIEEDDHEYEQLGSYFVYRKYSNIHQFFESSDYHRCEKKYHYMVQIDVAKCFDSIYTHSISWAIMGKTQTKLNIEKSHSTFAGRFDKLMRCLNHGETNGIVIGPEFSRIFAEMILQSVDIDFQRKIHAAENIRHKIDYEAFRYVDDYFIFFNERKSLDRIVDLLQDSLKKKKLSINTSKLRFYEKPIITEITIAKSRISATLNDYIDPRNQEIPSEQIEAKELVCSINTNRLIVQIKIIIKETNVDFGDLLNYVFSIIENKVGKLLDCYLTSQKVLRDRKRLVKALISITEVIFFIYSASPKVNHTIRLSRIVSTAVNFLNDHGISYELKHLLFKYVHDNIVMQIDRNTADLYREVETLYLLVVLSQIGKQYWLPESVLMKYFSIEVEENGQFFRKGFLNHFSITVLLSYMKSKVRFKSLREFIEGHIIDKLLHSKVYCPNDAEGIILFLDLIVCPHISHKTKLRAAEIFGFDPPALIKLQSANGYWFTAWADDFDIAKSLDAKRGREVY